MTTKEYLSQISRLNRMIQNKLLEISQLMELSYSISAIKYGERVQATPNNDKIGSGYVKIEEMQQRLNEMIDEYIEKKNKIISQIDSMEDEVTYNILFLRYIDKKTFEKIATNMDYSFRQVIRLHKKALNQFEKKYGYLYLG